MISGWNDVFAPVPGSNNERNKRSTMQQFSDSGDHGKRIQKMDAIQICLFVLDETIILGAV